MCIGQDAFFSCWFLCVTVTITRARVHFVRFFIFFSLLRAVGTSLSEFIWETIGFIERACARIKKNYYTLQYSNEMVLYRHLQMSTIAIEHSERKKTSRKKKRSTTMQKKKDVMLKPRTRKIATQTLLRLQDECVEITFRFAMHHIFHVHCSLHKHATLFPSHRIQCVFNTERSVVVFTYLILCWLCSSLGYVLWRLRAINV